MSMTLNELIQQTGVMSMPNDLIVSSFILDGLKFKTGLELGAGSGGWALVMDYMCSNKSDWVLVENFNWINSGYTDWPTNKTELENRLAVLRSVKVYDQDVHELIVNNELARHNVNFLRIDCDISVCELEKILQNVVNTSGLVFIDDNRVNCGLYRIYIGLELTRLGKLYPVWFGEKEAVYATTPELAAQAQDIITTKLHESPDMNIHLNAEGKTMWSKTYKFLATTSYPIFTGDYDAH